AAICSTVQRSGYSLGALVIDAALFVPQSRPRLFFVCVQKDLQIPPACLRHTPNALWHRRVKAAYSKLSARIKVDWLWWDLPTPPARTSSLADIIEENPTDVQWYSPEERRRLIRQMSEINRNKLQEAKRDGQRRIGGVYRRMREDESGLRVQRAEIRFDD